MNIRVLLQQAAEGAAVELIRSDDGGGGSPSISAAAATDAPSAGEDAPYSSRCLLLHGKSTGCHLTCLRLVGLLNRSKWLLHMHADWRPACT